MTSRDSHSCSITEQDHAPEWVCPSCGEIWRGEFFGPGWVWTSETVRQLELQQAEQELKFWEGKVAPLSEQDELDWANMRIESEFWDDTADEGDVV